METSMHTSEAELINFLDTVRDKELSSWNRQRSQDELAAFVTGRLSILDEEL